MSKYLLLFLLSFPVLACEHELVGGVEVIRSAHGAIVYRAEGDTLEIISIQVDETFQRKGQGTLLYQQMFLRYPEMRRLKIFILWDNLKAWMRASGTCEERYEATPSHKIERLFGFITVSKCVPDGAGVYVEVTR